MVTAIPRRVAHLFSFLFTSSPFTPLSVTSHLSLYLSLSLSLVHERVFPYVPQAKTYQTMGLTSLQACMDSSDWLQEAESSGSMLDHSSSSSPSAMDMLVACTRPPPPGSAAAAAAALMDSGRRLRPPHDHPLKCPRCESTHTKFCYYNNYSLSQPRYFCKTCRRYWTKGGTLRNIPVGGGCRKNKKPSAGKKPSSSTGTATTAAAVAATELMAPHSQLNYENAPFGFPHFGGTMGSYGQEHTGGFLESKYGGLLQQTPRPIDFLDGKFDLMGMNSDLPMVEPGSISLTHGLGINHGELHGFHGGGAGIMDITTCQRLMMTAYEHHHHHNGNDQDQNLTAMDVKPNPELSSLDWQQGQVCPDTGKDTASYGGYMKGLGPSWSGLMINGYGPPTKKTNSLV